MATSTVNISFKTDLMKQIDKIAEEESRSRSELIREAARMYIERKNKWKSIFEYGRKHGKINEISEDDIYSELTRIRSEKK